MLWWEGQAWGEGGSREADRERDNGREELGGGCGRSWVEDVGGAGWRMWEELGGGCGRSWVEDVGGAGWRMWGELGGGCGRSWVEDVGGAGWRMWEELVEDVGGAGWRMWEELGGGYVGGAEEGVWVGGLWEGQIQ